MTLGIRCLLADTDAAAAPLAAELDRLNRERRDVEVDDAGRGARRRRGGSAAMPPEPMPTRSACSTPSWHQGVVGIVAGRLKDRYHRPAIVFARGKDGELKGSGRSIAGFHLRDALDLASKRVAGAPDQIRRPRLCRRASRLPNPTCARFAAIFEAIAREQLTPGDLARTLDSDGTLAPGELGDRARRRAARPKSGVRAFPPRSSTTRFRCSPSGSSAGSHSKLALARGGERFDAILFRHVDALPGAIAAAYRPEINEWRGEATLQLVIEHWQEA